MNKTHNDKVAVLQSQEYNKLIRQNNKIINKIKFVKKANVPTNIHT